MPSDLPLRPLAASSPPTRRHPGATFWCCGLRRSLSKEPPFSSGALCSAQRVRDPPWVMASARVSGSFRPAAVRMGQNWYTHPRDARRVPCFRSDSEEQSCCEGSRPGLCSDLCFMALGGGAGTRTAGLYGGFMFNLVRSCPRTLRAGDFLLCSGPPVAPHLSLLLLLLYLV